MGLPTALAWLERLNEAVVVTGADNRVRVCNSTAETLFGTCASGQPIETYLAVEDGSPAWAALCRSVAAGGAGQAQVTHRTCDGRLVTVSWTTTLWPTSPDAADERLWFGRAQTAPAETSADLLPYKWMLDHAAMEAYLIALDGSVFYVNEAAAASLGYTVAELLTMNVCDFDPSYGPTFAAHVEEMRGGNGRVFRTTHVTKDGRRVPKEIHSMMLNLDGRELVWGLGQDVTERNCLEASLRKSQSDWQDIFQAISQPAVLLDSNQRVLAVNQGLEKLLGGRDLVGKQVKCWEIFHGKGIDGPPPGCPFVTMRDERRAVTTEVEVEMLDDKVFVVSCTPIYDQEGRLDKVVHIATDITDRKLAEESLRQQVARLVSPLSDEVDINFADLFDLQELQSFQDQFAAATGVASIITYPDGTPITQPSSFCRLCIDVIRQTKRGLANCFLSDAVIGRHNPDGPIVQPCLSGGLWDAGASITVGGRHVANWLIGQVKNEQQDEAKLLEYGRSIGADEEEFRAALAEVPIMSRAQFENIARFLFTFANQISARAFQNLLQARFIHEREEAEKEKKRLEDQLAQATKMEAIGRLAGGVAHDFNNLLTGIGGYAEMLLDRLPEADPVARADLQEIKKSAERAAALTAQLLAFSRKQVIDPEVTDLNELVGSTVRLLQRLIGEDIELRVLSATRLDRVKVDRHQMEQVLVNLAVNSRDAMPTGGRLTIETRNVTLDENYCAERIDIKPGRYVQLAVSDTGCGMTPEMQAHLFEPFFTTKARGKGTGLGLAMVYGILSQHNGFIHVYSEVGVGTVFKIYLPSADEPLQPRRYAPMDELPTGNETVLLVEDEAVVRRLAGKILERQGYRVLTANDTQDAYEMARAFEEPIDLMLSDVIMPGLNGRQLYEKIKPLRPHMRVLFMSGYTEDAIARHGVLDKEFSFLQKPFTMAGLARKVREVLDRDSR